MTCYGQPPSAVHYVVKFVYLAIYFRFFFLEILFFAYFILVNIAFRLFYFSIVA